MLPPGTTSQRLLDMRAKITGLKFFKGEVQGNMIDSGKVYAECKLDSSRNNTDKQWGAGVFTEEFKAPNSETVKRLIHIPLPFEAEIHLERVGNGREAREVVVDIVPITRQAPAVPAANPLKA